MDDDLSIYGVEEAVLGTAMANRARAADVAALTEHDFQHEDTREILKAIQAAAATGVVDDVTVIMRFQGDLVQWPADRFEKVAVKGAEVSEEAFESYLKLMREARQLRSLSAIGRKLAVASTMPDAKPAEVHADVWQQLMALVVGSGGAQTTEEIISAFDPGLEELLNPAHREGAFVPSGFLDLDEKLDGGFWRGDMCVIAARPGVGKTTFAMNVAQRYAEKGHPTLVYSLEMGATALLQRMFCSIGSVEHSSMRSGLLDANGIQKLKAAAAQVRQWPLLLDCRSSLTVEEAASQARQLNERTSLSLIVVDYMQLMGTSASRKAERREREVAIVSASLKALAKDCDCVVLALSQLSREPEKRGKSSSDHKPRLADLRESGAIEQDSDVVISIYRPEMANAKDASLYGLAEFGILKQRNGRTGEISLLFEGDHMRFMNYERFGRDEPPILRPEDIKEGEELIDV